MIKDMKEFKLLFALVSTIFFAIAGFIVITGIVVSNLLPVEYVLFDLNKGVLISLLISAIITLRIMIRYGHINNIKNLFTIKRFMYY